MIIIMKQKNKGSLPKLNKSTNNTGNICYFYPRLYRMKIRKISETKSHVMYIKEYKRGKIFSTKLISTFYPEAKIVKVQQKQITQM